MSETPHNVPTPATVLVVTRTQMGSDSRMGSESSYDSAIGIAADEQSAREIIINTEQGKECPEIKLKNGKWNWSAWGPWSFSIKRWPVRGA